MIEGALRLGGAERRFFRLYRHLRARGHDIHLFTTKAGVAACRALGIGLDDSRVHLLPGGAGRVTRLRGHATVFRRAVALVRGVRRLGIRRLHFGGNPGPLSCLYAIASRLACPFSVSLVDPVKDYQRNRRESAYVAITVGRAELVDCLSPRIRTDLVEFLGGRRAGSLLVSPCSFTEPRRAGEEGARDVDVCMIARMVPWKGHRLLRDALAMLEVSGRQGLVVHVCGSGPLEASLREEFAGIRGHRVELYYQQDPFAILSRAKVYVSLQRDENYPSQSLLEAMACGCAIVATDVGLTRLLLDERCAILVPPDAEALAGAIERLLGSEALRRELGARAREVLTSRHTIERFAAYLAGDVLGLEPPASGSGIQPAAAPAGTR